MKIDMDVSNKRKRDEIEESMRAQNFMKDRFCEISDFFEKNKVEEDQVRKRGPRET